MPPSPIPQALSVSLPTTSQMVGPSSPGAGPRGRGQETQTVKSNLTPSTPSRSRGFSDSRVKYVSVSPSYSPRGIFATVQPEPLSPSSTFTNRLGDVLRSPFRERSPHAARTSGRAKSPVDVPASASNTWFCWSHNREEVRARPWNDADGSINPIPGEQKESWEKTCKTVSQAVASILGTAVVVAHDTLVATMPLLHLVPVPGLSAVAKLLLNIWDAVQEVDTNRLAFLRLTERCACIVITLHQEMQGAGWGTEQELSGSLRRIEELFTAIQALVKKEGNIPFLKRYLKREETLGRIKSLNSRLDQELQILGPAFQIRTVKVIKEFAAGMDERIEAAIQRVLQNHHCPSPSTHCSVLSNSPRTPFTLRPPSRQVGQPLTEINSVQDDKDRRLDCNDLRCQIDAALQSGNDSDMLVFLQIPREDILEAIKSMQRHLEQKGLGVSDVGPHESDGALDHEFIENGIDSLRRMSKSNTSLPSWTITRFEIDYGNRVGVGFFSDVYEGSWNGRTVAVKVLRDFASSRLFIREAEIWKSLIHPNVIKLLGASSASGNPPWFFVSPFAKHGDLGSYLRRHGTRKQRGLGIMTPLSSLSVNDFETSRREGLKPSREWMLEIATGMDYLHGQGVLHGDLKCANVLLDENLTCLIADFGQSEMRAEACRMSGLSDPRGTLRWQAPEVIRGQNDLTPAVDVYAYAITCVEVLNMGQMPWNLIDDNAVQFIVLKEDGRPAIPPDYRGTPIQDLLHRCWQRDPELRPSFSEVVLSLWKDWYSMREDMESPVLVVVPSVLELEQLPKPMSPTLSPPSDHRSFSSGTAGTNPPSLHPIIQELYPEEALANEPIVEITSVSLNNHSPLTVPSYDSERSQDPADSNIEMGPKLREAKNEYRYRTLLNHRHHSSLSLALWQPVEVEIGAVGYLSKPSGSFVTLFNAINPSTSPDFRIQDMPSITGYGNISIGSQRHATRNAALRGFDAVVEFLNSGKRDETPVNISPRVSFPLRTGHKVAYLYTESTEYRYLRKVEAAKKWFKANVEKILEIYGPEHNLDKEGIMLIVGVLQAPSYALFVSHRHPDGNVHFHALSSKQGKPWGAFTTDTNVSNERGGPLYHEPSRKSVQCTYKVSMNGDPPKAVLLARLRFPPDLPEPTTQ